MTAIQRAYSGETDKLATAALSRSYRNTTFRLYESMGFRVIREVLVFRKDYEDSQG